MKLGRFLALLCVSLHALPACGGITAAAGDGGGPQGNAEAGSGSGGGNPGSGTEAGADSGGRDATTADASAAEAAPLTDGASPSDATSPSDAASLSDVQVPPDGPLVSVSCPQDLVPATCQPGQYCCVVGDGHAGTQTDTCQDDGTACAGTPVRCAVPADCPAGEVCCGTQQTDDGSVSYVDVSCAASCSGAGQRIFCDPMNNACPVEHPTCALSTILPGFNVCNQ